MIKGNDKLIFDKMTLIIFKYLYQFNFIIAILSMSTPNKMTLIKERNV